jgi:hypothetical protein
MLSAALVPQIIYNLSTTNNVGIKEDHKINFNSNVTFSNKKA